MAMFDWILASQSISRRAMLQSSGLKFSTCPAEIDEDKLHALSPHLSAAQISMFLAIQKAEAVSHKIPNSMIIGSDQTLSCGGKLFTKPKTKTDAFEMLSSLSGRWHTLNASVAVVRGNALQFATIDQARLLMHDLSDAQILEYLEQYWSMVKGTVGAYRMEAEGVCLFRTIKGEYGTILGLPLSGLLSYIRSISGQ